MHLPERTVGLRGVTWLLMGVILLASSALAFMNAQVAGDENRKSLQDRAATIAYSLDSQTISQLAGSDKDGQLPAYKELKARLTALKQVNSDARSIYLAGTRGSDIFFYVDSETPDSKYYSPPGETYPEATDIFKGSFFRTTPVVEGPVEDRFGSWISGLAPIVDLDTGGIVAVLGMDVDAAHYSEIVTLAASIPLLIALVLIIVILIYEWVRRRDQQLLQLKSELVSIASHELRTPITGIRWASERLLKATAGTPNEATVRAVYDSAERLQVSVEDVLQLTHVTSQKARALNLAPCAMTALVEEVCDTQRLAAQGREVKLVMDDSWPPHLLIACDADKIKRALHNIVSNAVKYTRDKTDVVLHYALVGKEHCLTVSDHGIGIPKEEQGKVFAGFYRASNAKATGVNGTGLGLFLTRTILEQHKGRIEMKSEEGVGTSFTLILPDRKK